MEKNKVLVIGALGQDGSYMCDLLTQKDYHVYGLVKNDTKKIYVSDKVDYIEENIDDKKNIDNLIKKLGVNRIYNFMGETNVFDPWGDPEKIYIKNFNIPLNFIETIRLYNKSIRFLQASSCLVFGNTNESPQTEKTDRDPIYHYGFSKNFLDQIINLYRTKFDLFLCSAIFYNHESERRGENFFTKKLIREAIDVKNNKKEFIELGSLNSSRDIGYAKDYMEACYLMLENDKPDDYIISSGNSTKLIEIVEYVFEKIGLSMEKHLIIKKEYNRTENLSHLIGINNKIFSIGWKGTMSIEKIIDKMIINEIERRDEKKSINYRD